MTLRACLIIVIVVFIFKAFASKGFLGFAGNYVQNIKKLPGRTNEIPNFWTYNPEEWDWSGTSNKKIWK